MLQEKIKTILMLLTITTTNQLTVILGTDVAKDI